MSEETSFCKQIDEKKYPRRLLSLADELVTGKSDGRISTDDADKIFGAVENDGKYIDLEKDTISYIRQNHKWTKAGDDVLRTTVRV